MATHNTPARSHSSTPVKHAPMSTGTKVGVGLLVVGGVAAAGLIIFWPRRAAASPMARQLAQQAARTPPVARATTTHAPVGHPSRRGLESAAERTITRQIQEALNSTMYCGGLTPDSVWGTQTENAARCFSAALDVANDTGNTSVQVGIMDALLARLPATQAQILTKITSNLAAVSRLDRGDAAATDTQYTDPVWGV